jgi:hypothetical protein
LYSQQLLRILFNLYRLLSKHLTIPCSYLCDCPLVVSLSADGVTLFLASLSPFLVRLTRFRNICPKDCILQT